jgi:hypothetical protein
VRVVSDRIRRLLVACACTFALAAGLWMLGIGGVSPHTLATADATDRAITQRLVGSAVKATLRLPVAALAPGSPHLTTADVVPVRADARAGTMHGRSRLYALFQVYQL